MTRTATALSALAVGGFAIGTTEFVTMGLLPQIADDLQVSIPDAGNVISAYALGVVVGAPLLAIRTARVSRTRPLLGLTAANVVGVPASSILGQQLGWRSAYWFVAAVGVVTVLLVWRRVPRVAAIEGAHPREELRALARPQVWLTVAVGAIGFGGMFAVYSYIAPILTEAAGWSTRAVPIALAAFGVGMTLGTVLGGRLADWSVPRALLIGFAATLVTLATFPAAVTTGWGVAVSVLFLGLVSSVTVGALQLRLMDMAGPAAASMGASLNHSALNLANASGAFLGGIVIKAGYGWTSPAWVGAGLASVGLVLAVASVLTERRARKRERGPGRELVLSSRGAAPR